MLESTFQVLVLIWAVLTALAVFCLALSIGSHWGEWGLLIGRYFTAERRAHALMREMLTPEEYQQIKDCGYLDVISPSTSERVYRIPGAGGLVHVYEHGHAIMDLCLQPVDVLPESDVVVMHKLMIQGNEDEYLLKANRFAPGLITLRRGLF